MTEMPEQQRILRLLVDRVPPAWTADERARWCLAFEATLDLFVRVVAEPETSAPAAQQQAEDTSHTSAEVVAETGDEKDPLVELRRAAAEVNADRLPCPEPGCTRSYPTPQALAAHAKQHTTATCWCGHVTTAGGIGPHQAGHKRRGETPPDEPAPEPPAPASGDDRADATVVGLREPCQDCGRRVPTTLIDGERLCQRCGAA